MISRIPDLPFGRKSFFLFGPRQVGKSTLVRYALRNSNHIEMNLLKSEVLLKYKKNPELLRLEVDFVLKKDPQVIVFIDEIQKAPELLNEVHYLIEKIFNFVLSETQIHRAQFQHRRARPQPRQANGWLDPTGKD